MLLGLNSCSYRINSHIVKTRYEYRHNFYRNKNYEISKWRKAKDKTGYIKYDKNGNEIEIAEYGEIWHFREVTTNPDSTIMVTSGHGRHMKKLNTVTFKTYNEGNQIISEECWRFKDNKKNYLLYKTEFRYLNGEIIGEVEYDSDGNISREMYFNEDKTVQVNNKNRPFYEPIVRVEGNSKYELKYDSLGREIEEFHYSNGEFLRRTVTVYQDDLITTYLYDDAPDKLWCYTEEKYNYLTDKIIRRYWKVIDSSVEEKEIFEYNKKGLLRKVSTYRVDLRTGKDKLEKYTKYRYDYY